MTKDGHGHVRLKRWYDPSEEGYIDLTDYEVYYDSDKKQFKAKFYCVECGKFCDTFCYRTDKMRSLLHELFEGIYCIDCFERIHSDMILNPVDDDDFEIMDGVVCSC